MLLGRLSAKPSGIAVRASEAVGPNCVKSANQLKQSLRTLSCGELRFCNGPNVHSGHGMSESPGPSPRERILTKIDVC